MIRSMFVVESCCWGKVQHHRLALCLVPHISGLVTAAHTMLGDEARGFEPRMEAWVALARNGSQRAGR